jgi:ZIP family zinc transporter
VSPLSIALVGAIAGFTIFLGLPIARLKNPSMSLKAWLNATATGILVFLLWDVISHAVEPVERALTAAAVDHNGSWGRFAGLATVLAVCLIAGLVSLAYYERWTGARMRAHARPTSVGPGAMSVEEALPTRSRWFSLTTPSHRLALLIAVGIGTHNFSEGLAIGQSAARDEISLALLLVIGFGLHNATEGFGITAPMAGGDARPNWGFLVLLGLIGGGPTFVGTLIGQAFVSEAMSIAFLALAAGSILYVVVQLIGVALKMKRPLLLYWGLLLGLLLGFATDFIITAAGV